MKRLVEGGEDLTIVGVVQPTEDNDNPTMNVGIAYPASLTLRVIARAAESGIVKAQLAAPDTDVFTGTKFGEETKREGFDLSTLFTVDEDALKSAFGKFDPSAMELPAFDLSGIDLSGIDLSGIDLSSLGDLSFDLSNVDLATLLAKIKITATPDDVASLFRDLVGDFSKSAASDPSSDFTKLGDSIRSYLSSGEARAVLSQGVYEALEENGAGVITFEDLSELTSKVMEGFPDYFEERRDDGATVSEILSDYFAKDDVQSVITDAAEGYRAKLGGFILTDEQSKKITSDLYASYVGYAKENALPDPSSVSEAFMKYLSSDGARALIADAATPVPTVAELAKRLRVSERLLRLRFRQCLGKSPHEALAEMRLDRAKRLVAETTATLSEIAVECGYADASHMSKAFSAAIGKSPLAFRLAGGNAR